MARRGPQLGPPDPWDLYRQHAQQAWADQQASSDAFDKYLLAFSSGTLALSLAFIKDIVPLKAAVALRSLYTSWAAFMACILVTIFSFALAEKAHRTYVDYLYKFYIDGRREYFNKQSAWDKAVRVCRWCGSVAFLCGIFTTTFFVWANVSRIQQMNDERKPNEAPVAIITAKVAEARATINMTPDESAVSKFARQTPPMTVIPVEERGRQPEAMTPVQPSPQPAQPSPQPAQSTQTTPAPTTSNSPVPTTNKDK
jgi:hypothetical protein